MRLSEALRIVPGNVVAFVGAGGKSAAIQRLTTELTPHTKVLVTTTTKIALDQVDLAQEHIILDSVIDLESTFKTTHPSQSILFTGPKDKLEPKWLGLRLDVIETLIEIVQVEGWVLLIEADGARGRSFKAPAQYEPVLPSNCDVVVPVVGLDVIGEGIASPKIHRAEILRQLLELKDGERISTQHVVDVLTSNNGGLKGISPSASVRVLLNKADSKRDLENGREITQGLIENKRIQSVLLASMMGEIPVHAAICRVGGVVLAAGKSTRVDGLKQLLRFREKSLVAHSVETALEGDLSPVIVVVGEGSEAVKGVLEHYPVQFVENPEPDRGQSTSVHLGLEALRDHVDAIIFLLADMPLVTSELVKTLVGKHQHTLSPIIAPFSEGRRGNPVLFDRQTFDSLQEVSGDQGGRAVFTRYPVVGVDWDDSVLFDVDSEDDLRRMREIE
jgi:molybdenum cofactor cytidylyltransferase